MIRSWTSAVLCGTFTLGALGLISCGGSGGGSNSSGSTSTSTTSGGATNPKVPTAATKADVSSLIAGYGQGVISTSFYGFGAKLRKLNQTVYVPPLGLYEKTVLGSEATDETFYTDSTAHTKAGLLSYLNSEANATLSGPISVTSGKYAGLTGTYNQALLGSSGAASTYNGTAVYAIGSLASTDSIFATSVDSTGVISGTVSNAIALQGGYVQTEKLVLSADGSMTSTSTDGNSLKSAFDFLSDFSGSGQITGTSVPGLPASVTWNSAGTGTITFADGSQTPFTQWVMGV